MNRQIFTIEMKAKLSAAWAFVLFNMIFRDIHEFIRPGFIAEVMTGSFNGTQLTEHLFLLGGLMVEVPISMVLFSHLLKYGINRWANIIAAVITSASAFSIGIGDLDDRFHLIVEVMALSFIIWQAWKWPNPAPDKTHRIQTS